MRLSCYSEITLISLHELSMSVARAEFRIELAAESLALGVFASLRLGESLRCICSSIFELWVRRTDTFGVRSCTLGWWDCLDLVKLEVLIVHRRPENLFHLLYWTHLLHLVDYALLTEEVEVADNKGLESLDVLVIGTFFTLSSSLAPCAFSSFL